MLGLCGAAVLSAPLVAKAGGWKCDDDPPPVVTPPAPVSYVPAPLGTITLPTQPSAAAVAAASSAAGFDIGGIVAALTGGADTASALGGGILAAGFAAKGVSFAQVVHPTALMARAYGAPNIVQTPTLPPATLTPAATLVPAAPQANTPVITLPTTPPTPTVPGSGTPATTVPPAPLPNGTTPAQVNPVAQTPAQTPPVGPPSATTPGVTAPAPVAAAAKTDTTTAPRISSGERLLGPLGRGLMITGSADIHGQDNSVSGNALGTSLYSSQNASNTLDYRSAGLASLQQTIDVTIQGKLLNVFNVNAHLSNSRGANSFSQVFGFDYKHGGTTVDIGTVGATLTGNELIPFSRSVEGIIVSRDFGDRLKTTDFLSATQAATQRGNFRGNGTSGPYSLNVSQIVPGSEHLQLNGNNLEAGKDYNLDDITGQVTFLNGTIINNTDTVSYTYEARTYNTTPGILGGTRWSFGEKNGATFGVTYIKQKATGGGSGDGNVTQYFPVYGVAGAAGGVADTTYKYQLSAAIDTAIPVTLKWNNEVLTLNVDYVLNTDLNYFQLKRELPADTSLTGNASLSFTYRPVQTQSVQGDKTVYGIDTRVPVSPMATVGLTYAASAAQAANQSGSGTIFSADLHSPSKVKTNAWDLSTTYRDIGQDFSSIDSTSTAFLQAQKGLTTSLKYSPNQYYTFNSSYSDSKVATSNTVTTATGTASTTSFVDNQSIGASLNINLPRLPKFELTHQQTTQGTEGQTGVKSTYASDNLLATWARGIFGLSGSIGETSSNGASVFSTAANNSVATNSTSVGGTTLVDQASNGTYTQSVLDATSLTSRLALSVTPATWVSITTNIGLSKNHTGSSGSAADSTSASDSTAHNYGVGVNLQPTPRLILTGQLANTTNGQSTSAFYNTATASAAAGTSTGSNTAQIVSTLTGQQTHSTNFSLQYSPLDNLTTSFSTSKQLSLIPGSDNTESDTNQFSLSYNPTRILQLGLATSNQMVTYVGGEGNSNNSTYTLTGRAGPFGKMTFTSSWTRVNYGSATFISTTSSTGTGSIGGITGTSTTTGLLQEGVSTTLTGQIDYALSKNKTVLFRWIGLDQVSPPGTSNDTTTSTSTSSSLGSTYVSTDYHQDTATVGFDVRFTSILSFAINYNLIKLTDKDNSNYSYAARTFTTDLSARF